MSRLAVLLEGVVRVGAVNCQEEFMLCRGQGISGYPSLNLYTMQHGTTKFRGRKEEEEILQFLVSFLPDRMVDLWAGNLDKFARPGLSGAKSWLVSFLLNILLNILFKKIYKGESKANQKTLV